MATPRPLARKPKATPPPHYYEGFLQKKNPWEKDYQRYWAGLHGLLLYFYNASRDVQYVEKIDLADFVSLTDETPPRMVGTWSSEGVRMTLKTRTREVMLKLESLESREMWRGIILTVVELKVPSTLALLPGHLYMLSEALEKEKQRRSKPSQANVKEEKELPSCFFRVSRTEAEVLLEKNENCGNMLLRPGRDGKSISVTTRQDVNGTVTVKHYKIQVDCGEYIIDVEEPFRCSSLAQVVEFFVTNSKRVLVPLSVDESYAMTLEIMEMDKESGESISVPAKTAGAPPKHLKGSPGGEKPSLPPRDRPPLPRPPPVPPVKPPVPTREDQPEHVYMQEDPPEQTYMNDASPVFRSPPKVTQRTSGRLASLPRSFSIGMSEELERKLQERRATLQE
nr:signal-transducing adaptor protein 2 isoform X1 [Pogona vitticeps]